MGDQYTEISLTAGRIPATDPAFLRRYSEMLDRIYERLLESKTAGRPVPDDGPYIYGQFEEVFGAAAVAEAFGGRSPTEETDGFPLWVDVLISAMRYIEESLDQSGQDLLADLISRQFWEVVTLECIKVEGGDPDAH